MSGGHFNYEQYKISQIADEIEQLIFYNDSNELDEWGHEKGSHYTPETIAEFRNGLAALRKAFVYAQRIDWLVSGDDGEGSFLDRLKLELSKVEQP